MWRVGASREGLPSEQGADHKIPRLSSVVWFATFPALFILETIFVLITPVTILVLTLVLVRLENESHADDDSRNEPSAYVDSRHWLCVKDDF